MPPKLGDRRFVIALLCRGRMPRRSWASTRRSSSAFSGIWALRRRGRPSSRCGCHSMHIRQDLFTRWKHRPPSHHPRSNPCLFWPPGPNGCVRFVDAAPPAARCFLPYHTCFCNAAAWCANPSAQVPRTSPVGAFLRQGELFWNLEENSYLIQYFNYFIDYQIRKSLLTLTSHICLRLAQRSMYTSCRRSRIRTASLPSGCRARRWGTRTDFTGTCMRRLWTRGSSPSPTQVLVNSLQ